MSERLNLSEPKILTFQFLIVCIVIAMSIFRFGYIYPDSIYYLDMVAFFSGTLAGSELVSPFCFRPLLPLIVAVLPFPLEISFAVINLIFLILIGWIIFFTSLKRNPSPNVAFLTTLIFIVSLVYLFYGAVVLVDTGAVFFLSLAYYYTIEEGQGKKITIFLTLGVLFKEIALVGVLTYLLWRKFKEWWYMIPPLVTYSLLRILTPSSNPGYLWTFHLEAFFVHIDGTFKTFLFGLAPFLFLLFFAFLRRRRIGTDNDRIKWWLVAAGIPSIAYLVIGLFFAHFDVRFLWPMYLMIIPLCTDGILELCRFIRIPLEPEYVAE